MAFQWQQADSPLKDLMEGMRFSQDFMQKRRTNPLEVQKMQLENALNEYKRQAESHRSKNYGTLAQSEADLASLAPEEKKQKMAELAQQMQYNPKRWEAEMGLQRAHTGKLGKETSWYDREMASKLSKEEAEMQQKAQINKIIQDILSGRPLGGMNQASQSNIPTGQTEMNQGEINPQQKQQGLNYSQASVLSHMLGLGKPQLIDVDGRKIAVSPFGNIEVAQGQTPLQKELTKKDAEVIGGLEKNILSGTIKQDTLNDLSSIVASPDFEMMRQHPIAGKYELLGYSKFGTLGQQHAVGQYMALTGQIIKDSARDFAGQFRIGEQALLNSMKPSLSDTVESAKGKIEALSMMNRLLTERSKVVGDLMRNQGMSLPKALEQADKLIDSKSIRQEIKSRLESTKKSKDMSQMSDDELRKIAEGR